MVSLEHRVSCQGCSLLTLSAKGYHLLNVQKNDRKNISLIGLLHPAWKVSTEPDKRSPTNGMKVLGSWYSCVSPRWWQSCPSRHSGKNCWQYIEINEFAKVPYVEVGKVFRRNDSKAIEHFGFVDGIVSRCFIRWQSKISWTRHCVGPMLH